MAEDNKMGSGKLAEKRYLIPIGMFLLAMGAGAIAYYFASKEKIEGLWEIKEWINDSEKVASFPVEQGDMVTELYALIEKGEMQVFRRILINKHEYARLDIRGERLHYRKLSRSKYEIEFTRNNKTYKQYLILIDDDRIEYVNSDIFSMFLTKVVSRKIRREIIDKIMKIRKREKNK